MENSFFKFERKITEVSEKAMQLCKNELEKMGLSVPDDVSIVGYDGIDFWQMLRPTLTTMRQDAERMGELAAEELARAVEEGRSYIPGRHVVGGTLLPGETVKKLTP